MSWTIFILIAVPPTRSGFTPWLCIQSLFNFWLFICYLFLLKPFSVNHLGLHWWGFVSDSFIYCPNKDCRASVVILLFRFRLCIFSYLRLFGSLFALYFFSFLALFLLCILKKLPCISIWRHCNSFLQFQVLILI